LSPKKQKEFGVFAMVFMLVLIHPRIYLIVVTYEIRVFFKGAEKEVFSSIFKKIL
jgi:hypothetical protein